MPIETASIERPASFESFDDASYLAANPDVAKAVQAGLYRSGFEHFKLFGHLETRRMRDVAAIQGRRARKLAQRAQRLDLSRPYVRYGDVYDFLTHDLRAETGIIDTDAISANGYDPPIQQLIERHANGLVLDCGAGRRPVYYGNVVNLEIAPYDSTDVLSVGESLPFSDGAFDAVISVAVLEHVRDPFRCAREIARVLKPGGELICVVPFLQPEHGYPHHYYNMAPQGLRALFERDLTIDLHTVVDSTLPVWSLTWIVQSWAAGLTGAARESFLDLSLRDLLASPVAFLDRDWVRQLPHEKNMELASATMLFAHKADVAT